MKDMGEVDEQKIIAEQLEMPKLKKDPKPKKAKKETDDPEISKIVTSMETADAEKSTRKPIVVAGSTSEEMPAKTDKPKRRLKPLLILIIIVTTLLLCLVGYIYYQNGSLATYSVNGVAIGSRGTEKDVASQLKPSFDNYQFKITNQSRTSTHKAAETGINVNAKKTLESVQLARQNHSLIDNLAWWQTYNVPPQIDIDEGKLYDFLNSKLIIPTTPPINASLHTESGELVTFDGQDGKGFTIQNPRQTLLDSLRNQTPNAHFKLTEQTIVAKINRSALEPIIREIKALSQTPIQLDIEGEIIKAEPEAIISWVDNLQKIDTKARFEINSGKVQDWLDHMTTDQAANVRNEVRTKNTDGTEQVLIRGRNSYKINNDTQIAKDIVTHLENRTPYNKTLTATVQKYKVVYVNTYNKWLLADLSNHMIYAYEKDELVNSFPMSAGAPETPTVVGQFAIYQKYRSQTMRGPNTDGTSYNVPNVEWVSYFHEAYAIHGNYWRPTSTFGSLNTSHGCIGMPNASSRWIYEWAPIGTPVITYE